MVKQYCLHGTLFVVGAFFVVGGDFFDTEGLPDGEGG